MTKYKTLCATFTRAQKSHHYVKMIMNERKLIILRRFKLWESHLLRSMIQKWEKEKTIKQNISRVEHFHPVISRVKILTKTRRHCFNIFWFAFPWASFLAWRLWQSTGHWMWCARTEVAARWTHFHGHIFATAWARVSIRRWTILCVLTCHAQWCWCGRWRFHCNFIMWSTKYGWISHTKLITLRQWWIAHGTWKASNVKY